MKKLAASFFAGVLALVCASAVYARDANVVVNGSEIDTEAVIVNDRVLVPLRGVYEELGFTVDWSAEEKLAEFAKDGHKMLLYANSETINIDGEEITPDVSQQIINDRFYLPLRTTGEAFGLGVSWDGETKTAFIKGMVGEITAGTGEVNMDSGDFSYKMNKLMPRDKNYMFSPLSIKMALALAANGADGATKSEIMSAVGIDDIDKYNAFAKQLISDYANNKYVELAIANSLWLNEEASPGSEFKADYQQKMLDNYNAAVQKVGMSDAVQRVNAWCSENTKGKIPSIIDSPEFAAILANAIYFKGDWALPFDKDATYPQTFTDRNGNKSETDFMHIEDRFRYYEDGVVQVLELPYKGGNTSMYFVLSGDKRVDINEYIDKTDYEDVIVSVPKFKIEFSRRLNDDLKTLGIKTAFDEFSADFTPMFDSNFSFYIDKVLHKTYIDVDETGTEAAAVTAIIMKDTAVAYDPEPKKVFNADKPFGYAIVDKETNEILFMGEYAFTE